MLKGVFHYNLKPSTWRIGREIIIGDDGKVWRYLLLGPLAINLGLL